MAQSYFEDIPAKEPDYDYKLIAQALSGLITRENTGAMVVGIHGPWGSGKTTLMQAIERTLRAAPQIGVRDVFVPFNAWKYQDRQTLWRALILRVLGELRDSNVDKANPGTPRDAKLEAQLDELQASLYRSFSVEEKGPWKVNWRSVIVETVAIALSLVKLDFVGDAIRSSGGFLARVFSWVGGGKAGDEKQKGKGDDKDAGFLTDDRVEKLAGVLERTTIARQVDQVQSIEQFLDKFAKLIAPTVDGGHRVFVFVDDLDRCLPESALEIFEAIKLFLDAPGCAFVLALDRDVIRKGLAVKYTQQMKSGADLFISPDEYIEKIISLSYDLPRLSAADAGGIIDRFALPVTLTAAHKALILGVLGVNPRRLKRFMNSLAVQLTLAKLAKDQGADIDGALLALDDDAAKFRFGVFVKLALLAYRHSGVFALMQDDLDLIGRLQDLGTAYGNDRTAEARNTRANGLSGEPSLLASVRDDEAFWSLMAAEPRFDIDPALTARFLSWFRQAAPAAPNAPPRQN